MNLRRIGKRRWTVVSTGAAIVLAVNAGCGSLPQGLPFVASATPLAVQPTSPVTSPETASLVPTPGIAVTPTEGEFVLNLTPLPTQTALPTLVLPTESRFAATFEVWDGLPTYPADSQPGFDFRVRYDPRTWARTTDTFGFPALAHRVIAGCIIAPAGGRGLPLNGTVEHDTRRINGVSFQINTAFVNGIRQFVTYVGGDGVIYTGFQVTFSDASDQCLSDAETVFGTLKAVSVYDATPIATP